MSNLDSSTEFMKQIAQSLTSIEQRLKKLEDPYSDGMDDPQILRHELMAAQLSLQTMNANYEELRTQYHTLQVILRKMLVDHNKDPDGVRVKCTICARSRLIKNVEACGKCDMILCHDDSNMKPENCKSAHDEVCRKQYS
jgi:hypothetical protein